MIFYNKFWLSIKLQNFEKKIDVKKTNIWFKKCYKMVDPNKVTSDLELDRIGNGNQPRGKYFYLIQSQAASAGS